ncbi:MAG: outer membrane protein assembly factor BamD [Bacteroidales bacterium]|nr:outer membrane protein assembly factor BamD [Bacteroidales bacterium]
MKKGLFFILLLITFASCGDYNKILKSSDYELKYEYAKKYYAEKKYSKAATLLEEVVPFFKGQEYAEESLYLLAQSYYGSKDYVTSGAYFTTYYNNYPKGEYAELARYYAGYGYYLDSPDPRLDQSGTYKAINEFQLFLEYFPKSEKAENVQNLIFELQDKLAQKELLSATLYYNLGNYQGNNYESAVITAQNALRDYPYSKYKEDLAIIVLKSRYEEALNSVEEKQEERFRDVIDEYYGFANEFPESKYQKVARNILESSSKKIND